MQLQQEQQQQQQQQQERKALLRDAAIGAAERGYLPLLQWLRDQWLRDQGLAAD